MQFCSNPKQSQSVVPQQLEHGTLGNHWVFGMLFAKVVKSDLYSLTSTTSKRQKPSFLAECKFVAGLRFPQSIVLFLLFFFRRCLAMCLNSINYASSSMYASVQKALLSSCNCRMSTSGQVITALRALFRFHPVFGILDSESRCEFSQQSLNSGRVRPCQITR